MEPVDTSLYEAVGGSSALLALAHAWHQRCLDDPVASHPFSHGDIHPQHSERLAAYWAEALGGPAEYSASMGDHTTAVRMHAGEGDHRELDELAIELFVLAMDDVGIPEPARPPLEAYFRELTTQLAAYPASADDVPAVVPFPHWSWAGPVGEQPE
jgi:hemoglobin